MRKTLRSIALGGIIAMLWFAAEGPSQAMLACFYWQGQACSAESPDVRCWYDIPGQWQNGYLDCTCIDSAYECGYDGNGYASNSLTSRESEAQPLKTQSLYDVRMFEHLAPLTPTFTSESIDNDPVCDGYERVVVYYTDNTYTNSCGRIIEACAWPYTASMGCRTEFWTEHACDCNEW